MSALDRVHILPTSTAAPSARPATPTQAGRVAVPAFQPPVVDEPFEEQVEIDETPQPGRGLPNPRVGQPPARLGFPNQPGQVVGPIPQAEEQDEEVEPAAPVATPGNPFGVTPGSNRPGVINPPPPGRGGTVPGAPVPAPGR